LWEKFELKSGQVIEKAGRDLQPYPQPIARARLILTAMRIPMCVLMGVAVVLCETIASQIVPANAAFCGFMTGFFLFGACVVLDFDRIVPADNTLDATLPANVVRPNEALSFAIVLVSFGLLSAASLGLGTILTAVLSVVMISAYRVFVKKRDLRGDVFVGGFVAAMFIFAGFAVGGPTWPLAAFAVMAFLACWGRAIMRNLGQAKVHARSEDGLEASKMRYDQAGKQSAACVLAAVAVSILPPLQGIVTSYFIPLAVVCDVGFFLTAYSLSMSPTPHTAKRNANYVLLWMGFGLLAFVIGTI
jgi:4-hydroxybenzoate polyprenyltransferase